MTDAGLETCFLIQIGNQRDEPELYVPIQQAQEELAAACDDIVMVSRSFKTFAAKGLMKDRFHYLQPAYNEVGEEAGKNVAEYWAEKQDLNKSDPFPLKEVGIVQGKSRICPFRKFCFSVTLLSSFSKPILRRRSNV